MSFILTIIGSLLLVFSVAGILVGAFMAADRSTRERGWLFALGWVPAVAAASGVLMRDAVTFAVGLVCFLVAGVVFIPDGKRTRRSSKDRSARSSNVAEPLGAASVASEKEETTEEQTSEEEKPKGYGREAS